MRVDKFLWCIRLYKTRTQATEACRKGHVKINNEPVKPSREVIPTDEIKVRKDQIERIFLVQDIPENRLGAKWVGLYVIDQTPADAFEKMKLIRQTSAYYRNLGTGRPTKKDRRVLDDFMDEPENGTHHES
ncbi:MAG: RNA-binding S4 domain-containing protein [Bacteroidetes bacterium]|nr:RNA-binding S4 domain-containing protein [Bacteroidota bacterium]